MPEINLIPEVLYSGEQPYHFTTDNLPLKNIIARIDLINSQLDVNSGILRGCGGTMGTLSNRLAVSIEEDGSLKTTAIDNALHNIAFHTDGSDGVTDYVRMTADERDKLSLVESGANYLEVNVETISGTVVFDTGTIQLAATDTITYEVDYPNILKINAAFPADAAHTHYIDVTPPHAVPSSPDYTNYKLATAFVEDSLKVYINGIRLSSSDSVFVPDATNATVWTQTYIDSSDYTTGEFALNRAITVDDVIRVDYIRSFI